MVASNKKGNAYAVLQIRLRDINNQYPRWPFPNSMVACPENWGVSSNCATLVAPDADYEINAVSTYHATASNNKFQITEAGLLFPLTVSLINYAY